MTKKTIIEVADIDMPDNLPACSDNAGQLVSRTSLAIDLNLWKGRLKALFSRTALK